MKPKYEISDVAHPRYPWLHRVRALLGFRMGVCAGDLGGYVQSEENLSQEGNCWIFDNAIACDGSLVDQQAILAENAVARGSAMVSGTAAVRNNAVIDDQAIVMAGMVCECAHVAGTAEITASMVTGAVPRVEGHADVYGDLCGNVRVKDTVVVLPGSRIDNPAPDSFVLLPGRVMVERSAARQMGIPKNPNREHRTKQKHTSEPER